MGHSTEPLAYTWNRLEMQYPQLFSVTDEAACRWHESQAESCEKEGDWAAAAFQLKKVLQFRPGDEKFNQRLATALQQASAR